MNVSFVLMNMLINGTQWDYDHRQKLEMISQLIFDTSKQKEVHTVTYFGHVDDIGPYLTAASGIPKVVVTETFGDINLSSLAGFNRNSFFIVVGPLDQKAWWERLNRAFTNSQGYARGVFIIPKYLMRPVTHLYEYFEWCWGNGFANVLVFRERPHGPRQFDIYGYERFPEMVVRKQTWEPATEYFYNKFRNFKGFHMRSPAIHDPPRVFRWRDPRTSRTLLKGYAAVMFRAFLNQYNGTLEVVQLTNASQESILDVVQQLNNGEIDISMNSYMPYDGVRVSYPIRMVEWCLLVPFSKEIAPHKYFLRPFKPGTWVTCIIGLLYLSILHGVSGCLLHQKGARLDFGKAFLRILRILLFLPIPSSKFGWHYAVCFLQAIILGFILSTLYLASLTSFLSTIVFDPQTDKLADVVMANKSINTIGYEIPILLKNRGLPLGFNELLVQRMYKEIQDEILSLRSGQVYTSREDFIKFALLQQRHMLYPVFHVARECITTVPVGFLMPTHSQFESTVNQFILKADAAGLTDKWFQDAFLDGLRAGILHIRREDQTPIRALSITHFTFAWMVARLGNLFAFICFVLENFHRLTRRVKVFVIYF